MTVSEIVLMFALRALDLILTTALFVQTSAQRAMSTTAADNAISVQSDRH